LLIATYGATTEPVVAAGDDGLADSVQELVEQDYVYAEGDSLSSVLFRLGVGRAGSGLQLYGEHGWIERNMRENPQVHNWRQLPVGTTIKLVLPRSLLKKPAVPSQETPSLAASTPSTQSSAPVAPSPAPQCPAPPATQVSLPLGVFYRNSVSELGLGFSIHDEQVHGDSDNIHYGGRLAVPELQFRWQEPWPESADDGGWLLNADASYSYSPWRVVGGWTPPEWQLSFGAALLSATTGRVAEILPRLSGRIDEINQLSIQYLGGGPPLRRRTRTIWLGLGGLLINPSNDKLQLTPEILYAVVSQSYLLDTANTSTDSLAGWQLGVRASLAVWDSWGIELGIRSLSLNNSHVLIARTTVQSAVLYRF
jgi:hypothetical protein